MKYACLLLLLLAACSTANDEPIRIETSPTRLPVMVEVAALPSATPQPTPSPYFIPAQSPPMPENITLPQSPPIAEINLAPATLPVAEWDSITENSLPQGGAGCHAVTNGPDVYVNVRDYPSLSAGVQRNIEPNRQYKVIAVAVEGDGTWYGLERGWVGGSVVNVFGDSCAVLPNASRVAWRSFGHVDFANLSKYREVKNIRVEAYMLNYPMLIFENGTIWHNPNAWQNAN